MAKKERAGLNAIIRIKGSGKVNFPEPKITQINISIPHFHALPVILSEMLL